MRREIGFTPNQSSIEAAGTMVRIGSVGLSDETAVIGDFGAGWDQQSVVPVFLVADHCVHQ